jgi:ABC-2 type transport system permease protein
MSATYTVLELRRTVRNFPNMFFVAVLPGMLYLVFGTTQQYSDESVGNGNVAALIMIAMASYGAAAATLALGGSVAVEKFQGWGRQLALTPLQPMGFVAIKAAVAIAVAAVPVAFVFTLGYFTGAQASPLAWVLSALACWLGSVVFALLGLAVGMAFRTESAVGAAGGMLVILAFLGNVFVPLSGLLLDISRFTPMYGLVALARFPVSEGHYGGEAPDPLWIPVVNVVAWTVIFAVLAAILTRRSTVRQ